MEVLALYAQTKVVTGRALQFGNSFERRNLFDSKRPYVLCSKIGAPELGGPHAEVNACPVKTGREPRVTSRQPSRFTECMHAHDSIRDWILTEIGR